MNRKIIWRDLTRNKVVSFPTIFLITIIGRMPMAEQEIALFSIYSKELGKNVGEQITLITSNGEK